MTEEWKRPLSTLDRQEAIQDHGTKNGYTEGCRGSHCPGVARVGMSCAQAHIRYQGDLSYRRRVDSGMSPEAIYADDQLESFVPPSLSKKLPHALMEDAATTTFEDAGQDAADDAPEPAERPSEASVEPAAPPSPPSDPRPAKWAVRRAWVAFSPEGVMSGPYASQQDALGYVGEQLGTRMPAPLKRPRAGQKWNDELAARLRKLNADGMSDNAISKVIGLSQSVVSLHRRQMGLLSPKPRVGGRR